MNSYSLQYLFLLLNFCTEIFVMTLEMINKFYQSAQTWSVPFLSGVRAYPRGSALISSCLDPPGCDSIKWPQYGSSARVMQYGILPGFKAAWSFKWLEMASLEGWKSTGQVWAFAVNWGQVRCDGQQFHQIFKLVHFDFYHQRKESVREVAGSFQIPILPIYTISFT